MSDTEKQNAAADEQREAEKGFLEATGAVNLRAATRRMNEIMNLMFEFHHRDEAGRKAVFADVIASLEAIKPRSEVESLLSTQMISTHLAAMECLKRAALPEQTFEGRQSTLNNAHKLMALYLRQVETLDKHRGKGQQKITVEHVNVEAGGQAIVGNVNTGRPTKADTQSLEHSPGQAVPMLDEDALMETVPVTAKPCRKTNRKPRKRS